MTTSDFRMVHRIPILPTRAMLFDPCSPLSCTFPKLYPTSFTHALNKLSRDMFIVIFTRDTKHTFLIVLVVFLSSSWRIRLCTHLFQLTLHVEEGPDTLIVLPPAMSSFGPFAPSPTHFSFPVPPTRISPSLTCSAIFVL